MGLIEYYGRDTNNIPKECEDIFNKLMNEGVNFTNIETNEFASTLLIHLGISTVGLILFIPATLLEYLSIILIPLTYIPVENSSILQRRSLYFNPSVFSNVANKGCAGKGRRSDQQNVDIFAGFV